jgi:hypothetical protein
VGGGDGGWEGGGVEVGALRGGGEARGGVWTGVRGGGGGAEEDPGVVDAAVGVVEKWGRGVVGREAGGNAGEAFTALAGVGRDEGELRWG